MAQQKAPQTLQEALDPAWLGSVLTSVTKGAPITRIETVEVMKSLATKVRFTVAFEGAKGGAEPFCLKAILDDDVHNERAGEVTIQEALFYRDIAPHLRLRVPSCAAAVVDHAALRGVVIIRDLVAAGARFGTAFDLFSVDTAALSLEQLAGLHVNPGLLETTPWVHPRVSEISNPSFITQAALQGLMDGRNCPALEPQLQDAGLLLKAMAALAEENATRPQFLVHGDCHGGNIYHTAEGPGLIDWQMLQRGGWALDVAYHISAVLPVDVAEREEKRLLAHYLDVLKALGGSAPDLEKAWREYRSSIVYGYFLWAITRLVDPEMTNTLLQRIGAGVKRLDSYRLLGI